MVSLISLEAFIHEDAAFPNEYLPFTKSAAVVMRMAGDNAKIRDFQQVDYTRESLQLKNVRISFTLFCKSQS